ncbi:DUF4381 domain-containing protein [Rheinheimera muenzenbergensis]|uniref:DUF4381 domain-containing protein n=1 Tax=Rheinheimera muenzenbergensis TaxID=1193628 RepID=A0ABU8CAS8_9GAMM
MANTHSPLDQLADISEPALVNAFALPPLAWFAVAVLGAGLLYVAWRLYRRWRFFAAKRQALALLATLAGKADSASQINQLLKRVLLHYQHAHPALTLPVAQWQSWLAAGHSATVPDLTNLLYSPSADPLANEQFYQFAQGWLQSYNGKAPADYTSGGQHA